MNEQSFETNKSKTNDTLGDYRDVHMRMRSQTVEKINKLQQNLGVRTRTDAISMAVKVAEIIAEVLRQGGDIIIEKKGGTKEKLLIPGVGEYK